MQFFEGKGYSDEFVCGMAKIVSVLENNNANLTLTGGCDAEWKELWRIARENIILKARLSQVCGDCKWSHICRDKADKMKSLH